MGFALEDRWVWDFWLAQNGGDFHMYFLQAPKSLGDPDRRHWNVSVGHAVSTDLETWSDLGTVLEPGAEGDWDDVATWTGSVIEADGRWWMFYTGASSKEEGLVQRIGGAVSDDLHTWSKLPENPLVEADPTWYEELDLAAWHDQAWRDPWVSRRNGGYEMLVTARSRDGEPNGRGVIGRATSPDLRSWTVQAPFSEPGGFGHMEVPQRLAVNGNEILLFSCGHDALAPNRRTPDSRDRGCYVLPLSGRSLHSVDEALYVDAPNLYSLRAIEDPSGRWVVLGFEIDGGGGAFSGKISDPVPLDVVVPELFTDDGVAVVD